MISENSQLKISSLEDNCSDSNCAMNPENNNSTLVTEEAPLNEKYLDYESDPQRVMETLSNRTIEEDLKISVSKSLTMRHDS